MALPICSPPAFALGALAGDTYFDARGHWLGQLGGAPDNRLFGGRSTFVKQFRWIGGEP